MSMKHFCVLKLFRERISHLSSFLSWTITEFFHKKKEKNVAGVRPIFQGFTLPRSF